MKKTYQTPVLCIVTVAAHGHILDSSPVTTVRSNADVSYGGGGNGSARVKEQGSYNVWDKDWSE